MEVIVLPMFSLPNRKLSEELAPILKKELEKRKYIKEDDPVYQDHVKKVKKIPKKCF